MIERKEQIRKFRARKKKKVETIISPFKINLIDDIIKGETPKYSLHKVFYISY